MSAHQPDDLLQALAGLPRAEPDGARSRAILASAARTIGRRRGSVGPRVVRAAAGFADAWAPLAACALSAVFILSVIVQAGGVLAHTGMSLFTR